MSWSPRGGLSGTLTSLTQLHVPEYEHFDKVRPGWHIGRWAVGAAKDVGEEQSASIGTVRGFSDHKRPYAYMYYLRAVEH